MIDLVTRYLFRHTTKCDTELLGKITISEHLNYMGKHCNALSGFTLFYLMVLY